MKLKNVMALLLAIALLVSLAACGGDEPDPTDAPAGTEATAPSNAPVDNPTDDPTDASEETSAGDTENPVTFLSMTYGEDYENIRSLIIYKDDAGAVQVEYVGDVKKVGQLDDTAFAQILQSLSESGLLALNGKEEWTDGAANASMYIVFADETTVTANFAGSIPQEYIDGYQVMERCFDMLTAELPVYVPQVQVMGEVDEEELTALLEIMNHSGIENLDGLAVAPVALDEYFAMTVGLSSSDGIVSGSTCGAMMMTTPFVLNVVTVADESKLDAVCKDFEFSMDWRKWVCVAPSHALIATKGDMVLCLMGSDDMYTGTANAIENAGWTIYIATGNPDLVG